VWENQGEGEGRRSIILSVLDSGEVFRWLALKCGGGSGVEERSSDGNKREASGSVSNLDGTLYVLPGEDGGIENAGGGLKCHLGGWYLGGCLGIAGRHLSVVAGIGIGGHVLRIMVTGSRGEVERANVFL